MDALLVVDKPRGLTSHDVVAFLRKRFGIAKAGHAGTLDPMATGVLIILLGSYTKRSAFFTGDDKEYSGEMVLGATSDTLDACGKITPTGRQIPSDIRLIEKAVAGFSGPIEQVPPAYSAVKYKGRKLYELARKGIAVERRPRKVHIYDFKVASADLPAVSFSVRCSKGTYVRQLVSDVGDVIGCGAYLTKLARTRSGRFTLEDAIGMDELKNMSKEELAGKAVYLN